MKHTKTDPAPVTVAHTIAGALDGEYFDNEGLFFGATPEGNTVSIEVQDAETGEKASYTLTIEAAK